MTGAVKDAALKPAEIYRTSKGVRIAFGAVLPVFAVGMLVSAGYALLSRGFADATGRAIVCLILSGFALFLAYAWFAILRYRIEVGSDQLVKVGAFRSREMRFDAIAGIRLVQSNNSKTLIFLPKDPGGKKLKINLMMSRSADFHAWARANFRDLDAEDREAALQAILADETLGADAEARGRKYRLAMRLARIVNGAGSAAMLWAFIYPEPYAVVIWILLALPFAALAAAAPFPGLIRFNGPAKGAYPTLSPAIGLAALGLALRSSIDRDILAWSRFWAPFAIISLLLFASILFRFPEIRAKPRSAFLPFLLAAAYGYGAAISYNCLQDHAPGRKYRAEVESKRVTHGKTTSYYLELSPWGPRKESKEVTVSSSMYDRTRQGDSVDVRLRNGALGIPWFTVAPSR